MPATGHPVPQLAGEAAGVVHRSRYSQRVPQKAFCAVWHGHCFRGHGGAAQATSQLRDEGVGALLAQAIGWGGKRRSDDDASRW